MFQKSKPLFLICETPLHAGSGDSLGIVDLPIQRERHTSFPKIEASSLKGALREAFEEQILKDLKDDKSNKLAVGQALKELNQVFGFDDGKMSIFKSEDLKNLFKEGNEFKTDFAGAIGFTDARLLLFPVKSMKGVFAWITCPRVLKQFAKDMNLAYQTDHQSFTMDAIPNNPATNQCYLLNNNSDLKMGKDKNHLVLEEYAFSTIHKPLSVKIKDKQELLLQEWIAQTLFNAGDYWYDKAIKDIVILSDDDFKDFVNLSTEVITRTKIDNDTGTVATGALFTEEYLPSESILYALILASPEFSDKDPKKTAENVMSFFQNNTPPIFQLGGNATLGKGVLRTYPNSQTVKNQ
ncbi:MAG: hypothetical protein RIS64_1937 [Bacteroidota bacterium]|jgi:CRISPR-associated protein Cmr4